MLGIYDREKGLYVVREAGCERGSLTSRQRRLVMVAMWHWLSTGSPQRYDLTGVPVDKARGGQ